MNLRDYQEPAAAHLAAHRNRGDRALVVCPAGGGKTLIAASGLARCADEFDRIGWACNTREQVEQGEAALARCGVEAAWVRCVAGLRREDVDGLNILVLDECFPPGTLVDGVPIESLSQGDLVNSVNHSTGRVEKKRILSIFERLFSGTYYKINTLSGRHLACTEGHPIFVLGYGYATAAEVRWMLELRDGTSAKAQASVSQFQVLQREVRGPIQRSSEEKAAHQLGLRALRQVGCLRESEDAPSRRADRARILFAGVPTGSLPGHLVRDNEPHEQSPLDGNFRANEAGESHAEPEGFGKNIKGAFRENIFGAWRKRKDNRSAGDATQVDRTSDGIRHRTKRDPLENSVSAEMLQGRFGRPGDEAGNRGGWKFAPDEEVAILRREEDGNLVVDWVVGVEVYKSGSGPRPDWLRGENRVYNLHVEGNENYFADGVLVHNCHHLMADTWHVLAHFCPGAVWGLTATPKTGDPDRDWEFNRFWGDCVHVVPRSAVMAGGHLAKGVVRILDLDEPGEFDRMLQQAAELESLKMARRFPALARQPGGMQELRSRALWRVTLDLLIDNPARNAAVVETARREIAAGHSVLVLVAEIEHGQRLAERIGEAVVAHSKMGAKRRREAIAAFRDGSLKCLVATSLADEGLDVPRASVLILACPGRSGAKIEQRTGRVMRPAEGKACGVVYDFADTGASMARSQHRARLKIYRRLGYSVEATANLQLSSA